MSSEDIELAEDFGVAPCTTDVDSQCCRQDEICKCKGEILEIFPVQCSIEPTYCEPRGKPRSNY